MARKPSGKRSLRRVGSVVLEAVACLAYRLLLHDRLGRPAWSVMGEVATGSARLSLRAERAYGSR